MWLNKGTTKKKATRNGLVAVAIDKDKGSQHALMWAADNLVNKGQTLIVIHVIRTQSSSSVHGSSNQSSNEKSGHNDSQHLNKQIQDLLVSFHSYCNRRDMHCLDVILEDSNIVKAIVDYVTYAAIESLVLGSPSKHGFMRKFKFFDVPSNVSRGAPDFCTVYTISCSKGKISSVRNAARAAPHPSPLKTEIENQIAITSQEKFRNSTSFRDRTKSKTSPPRLGDESARSSQARRRPQTKMYCDISDSENNLSFVSSGRPSTTSSYLHDYPDSVWSSRVSTSSEQSNMTGGSRFTDHHSPLHDFSFISQDNERTSCSYSSQGMESNSVPTSPVNGPIPLYHWQLDEVEAEMKRLKLELKQTMDLYSTACKEALTARQEAMELQRWKAEEEKMMQESRRHEESTFSIVEIERAKSKAAIEAAEVSHRVAEMEAQRRVKAEMTSRDDSIHSFRPLREGGMNCRIYTIEEIEEATDRFCKSKKIGEGGYGPVFKCHLEHTPAAVKVLRPDAAQGRSQFQREVEVLSSIRHPNMVLLLGACPEYGILVYEYMAKGSLCDRLYRRGNTPPLSWQLRFRIAAEIATGLNFLHQTKPEPLVHRDLKPANILLDQNYVSKIGDVGLSRLVPAIAENMTQYHVTAAAGTFCYIDPEYQQTGMLCTKSDVYSFGILLLEILAAKKPTGLAYYMEQAVQNGTFEEMLDPAVPDWPVEEALCMAKLAIQCAQLRRKDRPDLAKVVLPELDRLRNIAEESIETVLFTHGGANHHSAQASLISMPVDVMSFHSGMSVHSAYIQTQSSSSSETDKPPDEMEL